MSRKLWSEEEIAMLIDLKQSGEKLVYIAYKLKRNVDSVSMKLKRLGLRNPHKKWTYEEWQNALRLKNEGKTYTEIGNLLGRKRSTIYGKFQTMRERGLM